MSNWNNRVLYTGVTNNLERRVYQHKNKLAAGFTARYNVNKLVYLEYTSDIASAIAREKQIRGWARRKKNELVESLNPNRQDLSSKLWG